MPLEPRHSRDLKEKILPRLVLHRRLAKLNLHSTIRVLDDFGDFRLLSCSDLPPYSLKKVKGKCPNSKSPTLVSNAMLPEDISSKGRIWLRCVPDEASNGVGIEGKEKDKCKVMRIPERLEALLSYFVMGTR